MATLLEKYRHYEALIKAREDDYVYSFLEGKDTPNSVYEIWGHGNIKEKKVSDIKYHNEKYFGFNKQPTRKLVDELKAFAESDYKFDPEKIFIHYTTSDCRGAFRYSEIGKHLTKEQAEEKSKILKAAFEANEALIKAGTHINCQRCRKAVLIGEAVKDTIIGRGRDAFGKACITREPMIFCSGTCAGHEQMSREG